MGLGTLTESSSAPSGADQSGWGRMNGGTLGRGVLGLVSIVRPKVPGEVVGRVSFGGTDLLVSVNPTGRRFVEVAVVGREEYL